MDKIVINNRLFIARGVINQADKSSQKRGWKGMKDKCKKGILRNKRNYLRQTKMGEDEGGNDYKEKGLLIERKI